MGMFVISFLESGIFFLLPGDSLLFTAGLFSANGSTSFWLTCLMFFSGSFFGSLAGYEIGKRLERLKNVKLTQKLFAKLFSDKHIAEAHEFYQKKGDATILFCRFVPIIRTLVPVIAGVAKMNYQRFVIYNILGSAMWSLSMVGAGYLLGKEFPAIQGYLEYIFAFVLLATVLPVLIKILNKYKDRKV